MGSNNNQLDIFTDGAIQSLHWPPNEIFPLNIREEKRTVESEVLKDLNQTTECLILTGFTSLSYLVDTLGSKPFPSLKKVRIVLGFEPNFRGRKSYPLVTLPIEIKEYWIEAGFSILLGGAVFNLIKLIDEGAVEFRYLEGLHAKIYVTDNSAILGSANFSKNGLTYQKEANLRVHKSHLDGQYIHIKAIAENYYILSTSYDAEMKKLLSSLVGKVTWKEALARGIAEVVEGKWLQEYEKLFEKFSKAELWPTQKKGIAQALAIIENKSNVLIADPTGSGKTKFCSALILTVINWLCENGKQDQTNSLLICPPSVTRSWTDELLKLSSLHLDPISMGILSQQESKNKSDATRKIELANIVTIDEAHNYLNPTSNRSDTIRKGMANHTILVTATPINKKADDILRLLELLDIDNLSNEDFKLYKELKEGKKISINSESLNRLRSFVGQFTIRRTKRQLNREIAKSPNDYKNKLGKPCKYPVQNSLTYKTAETKTDIAIVEQINKLCTQLNGLLYLYNFKKPQHIELKDKEDEAKYIEKRLKAAKALTVYMIRASLRSSHVALVEHIEGSKIATEHFRFKSPKKPTGNVISKIERFKVKKPQAQFEDSLFPEWIIDLDKWRQKCYEEISIYQNISSLAKKLSGQRELAKLTKLLELHENNDLLIAFDSTIITLDYMHHIAKDIKGERRIMVVSGTDKKKSEEAVSVFQLGSKAKAIGLFSDKMSESVNLQQASALVLLDMPSVLRIVEQRIGRIDRMDSPHEAIDIYWADDSEAYSLRGDKKIIDTSDFVEQLFGANVTIPSDLRDKHFTNINSTDDIIKEYEKHILEENEASYDIQNGYQQVLNLKEGGTSIISEVAYDHIKDVQASIRSGVGFVHSPNPWCFLALKGSRKKSPRWYLIDHESNFHTEFDAISTLLRDYLKDAKDSEWDQQSLKNFFSFMKEKEIDLLPAKRKRAILMGKKAFEFKQQEVDDFETKSKYKVLVDVINKRDPQFHVDFYQFSEILMRLLQPLIDKKRSSSRKRVYNLNSLTKRELKELNLSVKELDAIINNCPISPDIDSIVAACIIGVPTF